ncbi:GNAT family N-acetyltransferase [Streptomyces bottropensis]|uniref:GNAT family N-acetyltransferase n=1 Tax=Streptomyces bottropensis TaxID=42235 RepID=UPI0037922141
MTSAGHQDLVVTRATLDDWAVVARWAGEEGWNPGLRDPACFFAQDPEGFFIGRIDGEPVSSVSVVTYGDHHAFLGFYLVRPDLRGWGHGLTTWKTALAHAGDRTVGLDGVVAQQDNYRLSGFEPAHRTFRYAGVNPGAAALPDGVRPVRDAASLAAYDSACHPADRPRFLQRWLTADGHRALARIVDGRLAGYGVIRPGRDALRIGPLFADTAADARALLTGLATEAAGRELAIDVPEPHTAAVALVEEYGLTPSFETARMYTGPIRPYAAERVFGVTTLELG